MTAPLVSVVIPLHNGASWIGQAISSILGQSMRSIEVLVVDDHSTDDGVARAERIAQRDERVRVLASPRRWASAARNVGAAAGTGAFLAFNDQDDIWTAEKLDRQVALLRSSGADLVYGRYEHFFEDGRSAPAWLPAELATGAHAGWLPGTLTSTRSAFERLGGFDESFRTAEDADFFMRAQDSGLQILLSEDLVLHKRIHDSNVSGRKESTLDLFKALRASAQRKAQRLELR